MSWTVDTVAYSGTPSTTDKTDDTETSHGEVWECTATPNDGEEKGVTAKASVKTICPSLDCAVKLTGEARLVRGSPGGSGYCL
jgi:hypothetical protein